MSNDKSIINYKFQKKDKQFDYLLLNIYYLYILSFPRRRESRLKLLLDPRFHGDDKNFGYQFKQFINQYF